MQMNLGFDYNTNSASLNISSLIGEKITSSWVGSYGAYGSTKYDLTQGVNSGFETGIEHYKLQEKVVYQYSEQLKLNAGGSLIYYNSRPGAIFPLDESSAISPLTLEKQQALEMAGFVGIELELREKWNIISGLRMSWFRFFRNTTAF